MPKTIEYNEMVTKLKKPSDVILDTLSPLKVDLIHMGMGIATEAGELLDAIKKFTIYNKGDIDHDNVVEELGDLEFFMEGLRQSLGIVRDQVLEANQHKLGIRYPSIVYSDKAAHERADKNDESHSTRNMTIG